MEELDKKKSPKGNYNKLLEAEHDILLEQVIQDEHDLYYLHVCLCEITSLSEKNESESNYSSIACVES